ncbi:MAG: mannosyltransferase [Solirubrobacteraceae bacterium]|jgi:4-amino-4-deoxy-L-arabinose transferase-like glycosyltransferase|nr:mannosyltransferase [Solirubrobacteraceae bacterium]
MTPRSRGKPVDGVRAQRRWLLPSFLLLILVAAGALFALNLGHSSLFIDEVYSWRASRGSLGDLSFAVRYSEVTPPLYYLILHAWMEATGGDSEALLRIPSVLAGVALVGALHWLGSLVAGRVAGLVAAALGAASPLVMLYSQQVRAYVWVMLALTIAVAAAIQATRGRSGRWLVVGAIAAACAVLLHYTSILVLGPLVVWLWRRPDLDVRWRVAFLAAVGAPLAAVVPLALLQLGQGHQEANATYASLTMFNALRVAGTPFDGRATDGLILWREIGAVVVIDALALLAFAERFRGLTARWLIVTCGVLPLGVVCLVSAVVQPIALTRYTAVAAPFILVAIGVVAAHAHRALRTALLVGAIAASGAALVASGRGHGQNPDTRAAITTISTGLRQGDVVSGIGLLGFDGALEYYADKLLPAGARKVAEFGTLDAAVDAPRVFDAATAGKRLWFIADPPMGTVQLRETLGRLDYRAAMTHVFDGNAPVQLVRAERSASR